MESNSRKGQCGCDSEKKPMGIDNRNMSEDRYRDVVDESGEAGGKERRFQEITKGLNPLPNDRAGAKGAGSKTEGAFGTDHGNRSDPENARNRDQER